MTGKDTEGSWARLTATPPPRREHPVTLAGAEQDVQQTRAVPVASPATAHVQVAHVAALMPVPAPRTLRLR